MFCHSDKRRMCPSKKNFSVKKGKKWLRVALPFQKYAGGGKGRGNGEETSG